MQIENEKIMQIKHYLTKVSTCRWYNLCHVDKNVVR